MRMRIIYKDNVSETFNIDFTNCECGCFCGTSSQNQFVVSNPLCYVSSNPVDSFIKVLQNLKSPIF